MPSYNLTIADVSPLWTYSGRWTAVDGGDVYANSTFHTAIEKGATATLSFNGTAVYLFGGANDNFTVTMDGHAISSHGTSSLSNGTHNLFSRANLEPGLHRVTLTREGIQALNHSLDLKYAIITHGDGNLRTKSMDTVLGDNATDIVYDSNWVVEQGTTPESRFSRNQQVHNTTRTGATVRVPFKGNAITVFGGLGNNHGDYLVGLDGVPQHAMSGRSPQYHAQQILYEASDLDPAKGHALLITTASEAPFDLDYVVVSNWEQNVRSGAIIGAVAGGVLGGILVLIGLVVLLIYLIRRHRRLHPSQTNALSSQEMGQAGGPSIQPYTITISQPPHKQSNLNTRNVAPSDPFADPGGPSIVVTNEVIPRTFDATYGGSMAASPPPKYEQAVNSARTPHPPAAAGNVAGLRILSKHHRGV